MIVLGRLADGFALGAGVLLLAVVAVTTLDAGAVLVARILGGGIRGMTGYEDFVRLAVGAAALMLFPLAQARGGHVRITVFTDRAPRVAAALDRVWSVATAAIAAALAVFLAQGMLEARADGRIAPVLGWAIWPFQAPGVAAMALWSAVAAAQAIRPDA